LPLVGWLKLFFKNVRWGKNKKHRIGTEYRLTRCPLIISFLCLWSLFKMVYFFLVYVSRFVVAVSSFTLAANGGKQAHTAKVSLFCQRTTYSCSCDCLLLAIHAVFQPPCY